MSEARRFEGQVFHVVENNGITALYSPVAFARCARALDITSWYRGALRSGKKKKQEREFDIAVNVMALRVRPIFTFTNRNRLVFQHWFSGDNELLADLIFYIKYHGGEVSNLGLFSTEYVPFSNASEMGHNGEESLAEELGFVTMPDEFYEVFGASEDEVKLFHEKAFHDQLRSSGVKVS